MGKRSQENGKKFEEGFCEILSKDGFFVIYNEKGMSGSQPCDLVAMKDNTPYLIECKNLENKNGLFPVERLEANQRLAYKRFRKCGNTIYDLAILWQNNIYIVNLDLLRFFKKSIDLKTIEPSIKDYEGELKKCSAKRKESKC